MITAGVGVLVVLVLTALLGSIAYLIVRIVRGDTDARGLALLADVARYEGDSVHCPVCSSTSFHVPSGTGIIAFAFGPLVLGGITGAARAVVECSVCASRFRRGVPSTRQSGASV